MTVVWNFPTRILFGEGSALTVGSEVKHLHGKRALLVTDDGVNGARLTEPITEALSRSGIETAVFHGVSANPLESEVLSAADAYRHAQADVIVAVGGGSVIDVAKLARLAVSHPMPLAQYAGKPGLITGELPPMIAVPTTAGAGSEVSGQALVTIQATHRKTTFACARLVPSVAVLDPALSVSLPAKLTAATGMSALARCIEAYCASGDHPMADAIALNGIAQAVSALERAVSYGADLEARGGMLKSSIMGSVGAQKGLGVCDALAKALAAEAGLTHGVACAICLPHVLDFNRAAVPDRIAKLARVLGVRGDNTETLAFECAGAVRNIRKKIGLPDALHHFGVDETLAQKVAMVAQADPSIATNPRPCTVDDLVSLVVAAL